MDKECGVYQIQEINLAAGYGAEKILQKIAASSLREKLLLRSNKFLEQGWYQENLVNFLEFFSPKDGLAETVKSLEDLFIQDFELGEGQEGIKAVQEEQNPQGELEDGQEGQEAQIGERSQEGQEAPKEPNGGLEEKEEAQEEYRVILYKKQEEGWEEKRVNPRIYLKIINPPYLVPFELELIPFEGDTIPLKENLLESDLFEETISYCMFSSEEYLSRSFYKILDDLELIQHMSWYKECYDFSSVIPVEATKDKYADIVLAEIEKLLKPGPRFYEEDEYTDQTSRQMAEEKIREKALRFLNDEVPHGLYVEVNKFKDRKTSKGEEIYDIEATIYCKRDSHKGIIIGKDGSMLKRIGQCARKDLEKIFQSKINLKLWVKVDNKWDENTNILKKFKYTN